MSITLQEHQSKITWDAGADPLSASDYKAIITDIYPKDANNPNGDFLWALKSRHLDYSHTADGLPTYHNGEAVGVGDCNTNVAPKLGVLGTVLNVADSVAAQITNAFVPGAQALNNPQVVQETKGASQGLLGVLTGIFTHHAVAIAREQNDLCAAANSANAYLDGVDSNFYSGTITQAQAETALGALRTAYRSMVAPVYKVCNAACIQADILDALIYMRTNYLYPKHSTLSILPAPIARVTSELGNGVSSTINKLSGGSITLSSGVGLLIFGLLLLLGVSSFKLARRTA